MHCSRPTPRRCTVGRQEVLDEIAATLSEHARTSGSWSRATPTARVTAAGNRRLSLEPRRSVRDYLVSAGIAAEDQLLIEGRGSADPVASNDTFRGPRAQPAGRDPGAARGDGPSPGPRLRYDRAGRSREVVVNDRAVPTEVDGSFRTVADRPEGAGPGLGRRSHRGRRPVGDDRRVADDHHHGAGARASKLEIGDRDQVVQLMQPENVDGQARYPDDRRSRSGDAPSPATGCSSTATPASVSSGGTFATMLPLVVGENAFGVVAVAPSGQTTMVNLAVDLNGKDEEQNPIVVREPVPQFSIELPPRGAVLPNPSLFVRGTASPAGDGDRQRDGTSPSSSDGSFAGTVELPEGKSFIVATVTMPDGSRAELDRARHRHRELLLPRGRWAMRRSTASRPRGPVPRGVRGRAVCRRPGGLLSQGSHQGQVPDHRGARHR